jgi:hypothetical protein
MSDQQLHPHIRERQRELLGVLSLLIDLSGLPDRVARHLGRDLTFGELKVIDAVVEVVLDAGSTPEHDAEMAEAIENVLGLLPR